MGNTNQSVTSKERVVDQPPSPFEDALNNCQRATKELQEITRRIDLRIASLAETMEYLAVADRALAANQTLINCALS